MLKVKCLNCGGKLAREDDLKVVCTNCGLVMDNMEKEEINQSLAPQSYNVFETSDSHVVSIENGPIRLQYIRLLERATRTFNMPIFIKQTTIRLFIKYIKNNNTIREKRYILASCFLISVRGIFKFNIRINDVAYIFNCNRGKLIRYVYEISKYFNLKIKPIKVDDCIAWLINIIHSNVKFLKILEERKIEREHYFKEMEKLINNILYSLKIVDLQGHNPHVLAASIIYCADKMLSKVEERRSILTLNTASKLLGISKYSIRDNYKLIAKKILLRALV
jgi:transcription initiation factor TFIIIB Brf1 subunit/transcription initiation factor TFIIB